MNRYEAAGADLAYLDTGPRNDGAPTLLLVHGFPLSNAMWDAQVESLRKDFRVVAPDLRGYGESPMGDWPDRDEGPSLDRYADDLVALLDHLRPKGPVTLVGFSMGGYIAFAMLRRHAGRFDRLVLMNTRAGADDETTLATRLKMADKIDEWGADRVAELMKPKLFAPDTPDALVQRTVDVIAATRPAAIAASQRAMAVRRDAAPSLGAIDKPTLVLVGSEDELSPPEEMRSIAEAIPDSRFVEVPGAGHMTPVEAPDAVNEALRDFVAGE